MKILETIVSTMNADGSAHISPLGAQQAPQGWLLAPFKPSRTHENLARGKCAILNMTDDVRIFSGCLTGRRDWPLAPAEILPVERLKAALSHIELRVEKISETKERATFIGTSVYEKIHAPFQGFNRAQAAVIELAIVASRLRMLPMEQVKKSVTFFRPMMEKTAGERERSAWRWLLEKIEQYNSSA